MSITFKTKNFGSWWHDESSCSSEESYKPFGDPYYDMDIENEGKNEDTEDAEKK